MAFKIQSTSDIAADGFRGIVYGPADAGKTRLVLTAPKPIIMSLERGLQSIKGSDIPFVEVGTFAEANEFIDAFESSDYETCFIDSVTELAEIKIAEALPKHTNKMQAYGELFDDVRRFLNRIRDMSGRNVVMTAKLDRLQDEENRISYGPLMSGKALDKWVSHVFPYVFAMHDDGLQTKKDTRWFARCRVKGLEDFEAPDLGAIFEKVGK